ncbi:hypothetical protein QJS10_CPB15g01272 [Acorus calamus]|uniref:Enhancer of polycomb-like protein n=1 Tax=Acorus calamus TaxID=4465 RepID=A0AAV9D9F1_ACOCL|nr:hypothetical protein QJS10_CPB15g01272 [Acorus calamus]
MSRLSFRPRPLDIHKKLPIFKSVKEFEEDEPATTSTRNSQFQRFATDADAEVPQTPSRKNSSEIPTPQFVVVDTYERDYSSTFVQTPSYLRGRGARAEIGEYNEYDLDDEDEDWLEEFIKDKKILPPENLNSYLMYDCLSLISENGGKNLFATFAGLVLGGEMVVVVEAVMQRRENNVQSFEKLRQVRRNLEQAKTVLEALIKREEKKREVMESDVSLQRNQIKYKHETQLFDDGLALSGFPTFPLRFGSSEDDIVDSDEMTIGPQRTRPAVAHNLPSNSRPSMVQARGMKRNFRQRPPPHGFFKRDPLEPVLLFTRPLDPVKLAAAGIVPPSDPPVEDGGTVPPYRFHGRIGRGGRIVFDRWNPLLRTPIGLDSSPYFSPIPGPCQMVDSQASGAFPIVGANRALEDLKHQSLVIGRIMQGTGPVDEEVPVSLESNRMGDLHVGVGI